MFSKVDPRKYEEEIEGKRIYLFQELLMEAFRAQFLNVITTPGGNSVSVSFKYLYRTNLKKLESSVEVVELKSYKFTKKRLKCRCTPPPSSNLNMSCNVSTLCHPLSQTAVLTSIYPAPILSRGSSPG